MRFHLKKGTLVFFTEVVLILSLFFNSVVCLAEIKPDKDNIVKDVTEMKELYESIIPVNSKAPDFTLKDINGAKFDSKKYLGKELTLLYFWSVFCPYCKKSLPHVGVIAEKYKAMGLKVLAINLDGIDFEKAIKNFIKEKKLKLNVPLDELNKENSFFKAADPYGVNQTPTAFLVNDSGIIIFAAEYDIDYDLLEEAIKENANNIKKKITILLIAVLVLAMITFIIFKVFIKKDAR